MNRQQLLGVCASAWFAFFAYPANAQGVSTETRGAALGALAKDLRERDVVGQARAAEFARQTGLPSRLELPGGRVLELQRFSPSGRPVFYLTYNLDAADTVSTDEVWPGGSTGLDLTGNGMLTAIWDGGVVDPEHVDFTGRLFQVDNALPVSGHATHVAGTLVGSGVGYPVTVGGNYLAQGMAFAADLDAYDWNSDTSEMAAAAAAGLGVSNHSYGIAAGWVYTAGSNPGVPLEGDPDVSVYNWWWLGGSEDTDLEDPNFGYYDAESQLWDQIAFDAPYYLIVKAAGNDRSDTGPAPGEPYLVIGDLVINPVTGQESYSWSESTLARPFDCAPAGYDCLPTNSGAKNVLTVGAVDDIPGGYAPLAGPGQVLMPEFSSWGPTDDGRIKPDLVGNGVFLLSAYPTNSYAAAAGTSMAAPNVAGSLLLLQQHYENLNGGSPIRAATLKALAIHTADEAGNADGPDYAHGWGLLNTASAARLLSEAGAGDHHVIEGTLVNGGTDSHQIDITVTDARVTATLAWTDPPGSPVTPQVLDAPDPMLVNDLDVRITNASGTHLPWVLDPANPADPATTGDNVRDNVEQVVITGGTPGTYTIEISHKGSLQNGSQAYSLIVSQVSQPEVGSELVLDEDFSGGLPPGWSTGGVGPSWLIRDPVPGDSRYDNNTLGSGRFAMVDVDYSAYTNSWLQLPELDLSAASSVVFRFQSFYYYDTWEILYLELSTDGGATFNPVWQTQGFNPYPTQYVLDLSGSAGGQASAIFRFRFDSWSDPVGDLWQVDNVQVEAIGGTPAPNEDPPGPASAPVPFDGATNISVETGLAWSAGVDADSHDVYFSDAAPLTGDDFAGNQTADGFDPGTLQYATTYYWRVDEVNAYGTTTGATWSFTTEAEPPPPAEATPLSLGGLTGTALPPEKGRWTAAVDVLVVDDVSVPVDGVTVSGDWSDGASGAGNCLTGADGRCAITKSNLKSNVVSVTFTVTGLEKAGHVYEPAANAVADSVIVGESGGGSDPEPPPPSGDASLTVNPYKVKGVQTVELTWSGIDGETVDIFRDGAHVAGSPTANDGHHVDDIGLKGGGSYEYAVCEANTSTCAVATAVF